MSLSTPPYVTQFAPGAHVTAHFSTSLGNFSARLFAAACPITVGNFVGLARGETPWLENGKQVKKPLYDGTLFHRVIPDFMIQGGDPAGNGSGGPGYRFDDEIVASLRHTKAGLLSMANAGPNTNGSQFFVTDAATPWLDDKHTIFGEVTDGLEVVKSIARVPCGANDRPRQDVILTTLKIEIA